MLIILWIYRKFYSRRPQALDSSSSYILLLERFDFTLKVLIIFVAIGCGRQRSLVAFEIRLIIVTPAPPSWIWGFSWLTESPNYLPSRSSLFVSSEIMIYLAALFKTQVLESIRFSKHIEADPEHLPPFSHRYQVCQTKCPGYLSP